MEALYPSEQLAALMMAKDATDSVDENEIARLTAIVDADKDAAAQRHLANGHIAEYQRLIR